MRKFTILMLLLGVFMIKTNAQTAFTDGSGYWTFDDAANLLKATKGTPLELWSGLEEQTGKLTSIAGYKATDKAVTVPLGTYFKVYHGINSNGKNKGTTVTECINDFTLVMDIRISKLGQPYCLFEANPNNTASASRDADWKINTEGALGAETGTMGYSTTKLKAATWYRIGMSLSLGTGGHSTFYIDGKKVFDGPVQELEGAFAPYGADATTLTDRCFKIFSDNNAEDNSIDVSMVAVFGSDLNDTQMAALGKPDAATTSIDQMMESIQVQNYPNPFSSLTTIQFSLKKSENVNVSIYDLQGKMIKTLVNAPMGEGIQRIQWNAKDDAGCNVSAGQYFFKVRTDSFIETRKMMLVK